MIACSVLAMSERRNATDQPAVIYLITSRGYLSSPPLEWKDDGRVEHDFIAPKNLYVNGFFVTHPDGAVLYQSESEMSAVEAGKKFSVAVTLSDECNDPNCRDCAD